MNKLGLDLLESRFRAGHPGVLTNLVHCQSLGRVELQEGVDQIDKRIGEEPSGLVFRMCTPEQVVAVGADQFIERVFRLSTRKWWVLGKHDEKDNSRSEQIN